MLSGLFFVNFVANNNNFGSGVVVVSDGKVNGGDSNYFYQGRFDYYGNDIKALIKVKHYRGNLNSVMGPLKEFTLNLSGKKTNNGFEVSGWIPDIPNLSIMVRGIKIAELFE